MTYVRPHVRRDGTFVKGHYRKTRPRTAARTSTPRRPRPTAMAPRSVQYGPTTYVRPYNKSDGTRVRGHHRTISPRTVAVTAGTSTAGIVILVLILLALSGSGSDTDKKPTRTTPLTATPSANHR